MATAAVRAAAARGLTWFLVGALGPGMGFGKEVAPRSDRGWRMFHHSFERTLTYDDTLGDWLASASTMALRDRVQLLPSVKNRYGLLWSRKAIDSTDFEISFTMSATDNGESKGEPHDGAVVFWLMPDNFATKYNEQAIVKHESREWEKGLQQEGLTLLGNRPSFEGLAFAFASAGQQKVAGLWSDGKQPINTVQELVDRALPEHRKSMDWMSSGTQVKVAVKPDGSITGSAIALDVQKHLAGTLWGWAEDGVNTKYMLAFRADGTLTRDENGPQVGTWTMLSGNKVRITQSDVVSVLRFEGSLRAVVEEPAMDPRPAIFYGGKDLGGDSDWQVIFRLPAGTFPKRSQAFFGFTGYTGSKAYIEVDFHRIDARNFDAATVGEDESDMLKGTNLQEWAKVLEEEKRYVSQASQADAVARLTQLLTEHIDRFDKAGAAIQQDLAGLEAKLDVLSADFSSYLAATQAFSFEGGKFDVAGVRQHIAGIQDLLAKSKNSHDRQIANVAQAAANLKAVSDRGPSTADRLKVGGAQSQAKLLEQASRTGYTSSCMLILLIVGSVGGIGFIFLNRMRYYEKKHYI